MGVYMWELCCHDSILFVLAISSHHIFNYVMFLDFSNQLVELCSYVLHILE